MKIVVIGGSGLIGSKTVNQLRQHGHDVVAASPSTGVNTETGEGLAEACAGTDVVIDVANSPSFESAAAHAFFEAAGRNIFAAEKATGVKHHVALSVVGTERLLEFGYFGAKLLRENLARVRRDGGPLSLREIEDRAIAAYNAGWSKIRPGDAPRDAGGAFINQASYVAPVRAYYSQLSPAIAATPATPPAPSSSGSAAAVPAGSSNSPAAIAPGAIIAALLLATLLLASRFQTESRSLAASG